MNTGLLNRRHLAHNDQVFATVIPGEHTVAIRGHKYQDILQVDPPEMSYADYQTWLHTHQYTEKPNRASQASLNEEHDQIPQEDKTTLTDTLERQTTLFDYL